MHPFEYLRALDPAAALTGLAKDESAALGGGTNLVDLMRLEVMRPRTLVDVSRLELAAIEGSADGLAIGAMARNSDVAAHPLVK